MAADESSGCKDIDVGAQPFDLAFHPTNPLVAVGLITGRLHLYDYNDADTPRRQWDIRAHNGSCRAVRFAEAGRFILSGSPDHSVLATDTTTGQTVARLSDAHNAAINRIVNVTETTIATGDDDGTVKVWDTRQNTCCCSYSVHEDFISDMNYVPDALRLLTVSGDGTLSIFDIRRSKVEARSEFAEDELLSVVVAKNGRKIICGSQEGVLLLYSWGHYHDCSDRFVGHPNSVDSLLKLDEETLLTGSSDGMIRIVSILPNKMLGIVGEHADYPIERLAFSHDKHILGSASHDNSVKLWDVAYLLEESDEIEAGSKPSEDGAAPTRGSDDSDEEMEEPAKSKASKKGKDIKSVKQSSKAAFFADI